MTITTGMTATALAAALMLGGTSGAFAKAHDQGRADGTFGADNDRGARTTIDALTEAGLLDGNGVSAVVKDGARGEGSSAAQGDNRVEPVVPD